MTKARLPYMPLFVADFLSSPKVMAMSAAEIGAYCLLLMNCWSSGDASLPSDDNSLASISKLGTAWKKSRTKILACFDQHPEVPGLLTNLRLMTVWNDSLAMAAKRSDSGRIGAKSRWQNDGNRNGNRIRLPSKNDENEWQNDAISNHQTINSVPSEHKDKKPQAAKFAKPSIEEVDAYCRERRNRVNPAAFWDYYESVGWKIGNKPMRSWQASVRTWEKRNDERPTNQYQPTSAAERRESANDAAFVGFLHAHGVRADDGDAVRDETHGGLHREADARVVRGPRALPGVGPESGGRATQPSGDAIP